VQSTLNPTILCIPGQCLEGYSNVTRVLNCFFLSGVDSFTEFIRQLEHRSHLLYRLYHSTSFQANTHPRPTQNFYTTHYFRPLLHLHPLLVSEMVRFPSRLTSLSNPAWRYFPTVFMQDKRHSRLYPTLRLIPTPLYHSLLILYCSRRTSS
jgi:hypothetical protein